MVGGILGGGGAKASWTRHGQEVEVEQNNRGEVMRLKKKGNAKGG